jgi:hypothetical protein
MNAIVSLVLGLLLLGVLYVVIFTVLRSGFSVARRGTIHLERRKLVSVEPVATVVGSLVAKGWSQVGPVSEAGDTTVSHGVLILVVSPAPERGTIVAFLGVACREGSASHLERTLHAVFGEPSDAI